MQSYLETGREVTGIKRTKPQAKGYSEAGASRTRRAMRDFKPASGSPHEDIDENNYTLRQRSRMLYMGAPVAAGAINTCRTNIIGTGLTLQATPDNRILKMDPEALKEWQRKVEAEFALWAESRQCDALGINNFSELQEMALRSWLLNGDVFVLLKHDTPTPLCPYTMRLHVIEADRISTPNTHLNWENTKAQIPPGQPGAGNWVYDGVEVDSTGAVQAYHVCNMYPFEYKPNEPMKWTRVPVNGPRTGLPNILHIMQSERPDSYRGVPYLAKVIEPLLQLRRYTESELMSALIQTFFTAWIYTETPKNDIPFNEVGEPGDEEASFDPNEYEMGPGTINHLAENERVTFGQPTMPTTTFEMFTRTVCKMVGSELEIPYELLMKEFTSSYSASRGALLEAWKAFRMRRKWFADDFCNPVYQIFLSEAVASGRVKAPGFFEDPLIRKAWSAANWVGPAQESLDPTKEVNAAILSVQNGFKTHAQVARETSGTDWEANVAILKSEMELLKDAGITPEPAQPAPDSSSDSGGSGDSDDDSDDEDPNNSRPARRPGEEVNP